jgi:hypothetical protein
MAARGTPRRQRFSPRTRLIIRISLTAVALAVVILVVASLTLPKRTVPSATVETSATVTVPGADAYNQGLAALASGDTTRGLTLLKAAAAAGNKAAAKKVADIENATPSTPASSTPTTSTPGAYDTKVADIASLLPTSVPGFDARTADTSTISAILPYQANRTGPFSSVTLVLVSVLDKGTPAKAAAFVTGLRKAFNHSASNEAVGAVSGRFATDGLHLASFSFARGRYAFQVVFTASPRVTAVGLKSDVLAFAAYLPAAH